MTELERLLPADGTPPLLAVVGASGMGKTELLGGLAFAIEDRGGPVWRCKGHRLEQAEELAGLEDIFELLGIDVPDGARAARICLLDRIAADHGTLVIDDAQWLDPATVRILVAVAERAADAGAGLIAGHRPVMGRDELTALDAALSRQRPVIRLGPLTVDDVAAWAAGLTGSRPDASTAEAILSRTDGVPLFVDCLVTAWHNAGVLQKGRLVADAVLPLPPAAPVVQQLVDEISQTARSLLSVLAVAPGLEDEVVCALLGLSAPEVATAMEELRAAGVIAPARSELVPVVDEAVESLTPLVVLRDLHARLARVLAECGAPAGRVAEHVVAARATGPDAVQILRAAGDESLTQAPELAMDWYREAVRAGADGRALAARRAEAAARAGDTEAALRLADEVVADADAPERERGLAVLAALLPCRGLWRRSGEGYTDLAQAGAWPGAADLAVLGLVAVGAPLPDGNGCGSETASLGGTFEVSIAGLLARGVLATVSPDPVAASMPAFLEAVELLEASHHAPLLPDTPHALGAVTAIAAGELRVGQRLLESAIANRVGGAAFAARHQLLAGWVALRSGRWAAATEALAAAGGLDHPCGRDRLLAVALAAGLARREGDLDRLHDVWPAAQEAVLRHPADIWCTEALGELGVVGARLRDQAQVAGRMDEVEGVLDRLGTPPLWSLPLRWYRLEAALVEDDAELARWRAKALAELPPVTPALAGVAAAGLVWADVLGGTVDPARVQEAAAGLRAVGMTWEASRLTAAAASRAADPGASRILLQHARDLTSAVPAGDRGEGVVGDLLSAREREVASLVVAGLTHKEIGAQLFISPKTVEHHVARIRQRVGATSRAELLSELRAYLASA